MINGVAAPVTADHFLMNWLEKNGYKVQVVEPMLGETIEVVKEEPEAILAWSLGGFLAPKLAEKYPKAKLILIATGARAAPKDKMTQILFDLVKGTGGVKVLYWSLRLPKSWLAGGYKKMIRLQENDHGIGKILIDNIEFFRRLPVNRIYEVVELLKKVDNNELLKKLRNKTLVIGGENDSIMPKELAVEMNELVRGSKLVITEGGHFNAVDDRYLEEIGKFLGVK